MMTGYIFCIGQATADHIFDIQGMSSTATKVAALEYQFSGGGMAANAAVAIARLGGRAEFCGRLGSDKAGRDLIDEFHRYGVGTDAISFQIGARTSVSAVLVDERGERSIFNFRGKLDSETSTLCTSTILEFVEKASVVLADVRWSDGATAALREARRRRISSVLDADCAPREDLEALVALSDYAIFSTPGLEAFAPGLTPDSALEKAMLAGCTMAAVTLGEDGVLWRTRESGCGSLPAFHVTALETLAAGDVFHGAFALALGEGQHTAGALRFAAAAAALKCTRTGGRPAMPARAEVEMFLRTQTS